MLLAVTLPCASTLAMSELLLLQVTVLSVAFSGVTVAARVAELPSCKVSEVLSREMAVTGTVASSTVTVQLADLLPAMAVTVADPDATAVTLPFSSTVTTAVLPVLQVTFLSVAFSGKTVATSVSVQPGWSDKVVLLRTTLSTGTLTSFLLTNTSQETCRLPA